jgi:hypothetical protein
MRREQRMFSGLLVRVAITGLLIAGGAVAQQYVSTFATTTVGTVKFNFPNFVYTGYNPVPGQGAVLGDNGTGTLQDRLLLGDAISKGASVLVTDYSLLDPVLSLAPTSQTASYMPAGDAAITYEHLGGMVVLRPMRGAEQSALVVLASTRNLYVYEIQQGQGYASKLLKTIELPTNSMQSTDSYSIAGNAKRLALLSTSVSGGDTYYHLAIGNPTYQLNGNVQTGRVDFITLNGTTWSYSQPNTTGITSLVPANMYALAANSLFGVALAPAGDVDGDGVVDLAVLASVSTPNAQSALYVFFMQDASTPKAQAPKQLGGAVFPWYEENAKVNAVSGYTQDCQGLGSVDLDGDKKTELLMSCTVGSRVVVRSLRLAKDGSIAETQVLAISEAPYYGYGLGGDPLAQWNKDDGAPTLVTTWSTGLISRSYQLGMAPLYQVDLAPNFTVQANDNRVPLVNLDSIFYRQAGITGYTLKSLSGLANCEVNASKEMACKAAAAAAGSWSSIEVNATGACDAYRPCKLKDTLYVYGAPGTPGPVLRLPSDLVLLPKFSTQTFGSLRALSYMGDYSHNKTVVKWSSNKPAQANAVTSPLYSLTNSSFALASAANELGVDTLEFTMALAPSTEISQKMRVHVVNPLSMRVGVVPATPKATGDTLYSVATGQYIALPLAAEDGTLYTYDVAQDLGGYGEIVGNYLHITMAEEDKIHLNYVENQQIKTRTLVMTTLADPDATPVLAPVASGALQVRSVSQGVLLEGMVGDYQVYCYGLDGQLLQQVRGYAQGTTLVPLLHAGVQIVRVHTALGVRRLTVAR